MISETIASALRSKVVKAKAFERVTVNRFRKRKPRALLRWWRRRIAIEPVIGHVKSDHYMQRNRLGGVPGDKLNVMLSALGFNLVKLIKALKKRWIKRLFLYFCAIEDGFRSHVVDNSFVSRLKMGLGG